jgi:hypothetical protein
VGSSDPRSTTEGSEGTGPGRVKSLTIETPRGEAALERGKPTFGSLILCRAGTAIWAASAAGRRTEAHERRLRDDSVLFDAAREVEFRRGKTPEGKTPKRGSTSRGRVTPARDERTVRELKPSKPRLATTKRFGVTSCEGNGREGKV